MHTEALNPVDQARRCAHCNDRVPSGLIDSSSSLQFCCNGCRTVYQVIHGCGLDRYYALRQETVDEVSPAKFHDRRFSEFDDATFRRLYVRELGGGLASVELFVASVHCAACVWLIEKLPMVAPGVIEARLDLRRALVRITWDENRIALSAIARALNSLGYPPAPARSAAAREARRVTDRQQIVRLGVAGACAGNVMLLAFALYSGMFDAIEPAYLTLFRWVSMSISVVSLAWPGRVFFIGAYNALRTQTLHLDVPIALGLGAGAVWGIINTLKGSGEIYFDSLSVLVFALLLGRFIQSRQQRSTSDSLELLFSLTPAIARVVADEWANDSTEAPIEAIKAGMFVEVRAGDSIPVDGVIIRGESKIDQALLTGESRPVHVREGMGVAAGAVNLSSTIRVRVEATGEDTRVGRLMRLVQECAQRRAPIVKLADRIAGWFVSAMLILALLTVGLWLWLDPSRAIDNAVALLIVTCPCALGLATPLAFSAAIGRAARRGMLIKGGDALQTLGQANSQAGTIFLDKTGTITQGRTTLVQWLGDQSLQPMVAALERHCTHPIAQALVRDLSHTARIDTDVHDVHHTLGGGIEGTVNGRRVLVGSPTFVRHFVDQGKGNGTEEFEERLGREGLTPVLIAVEGRIVAAAGLGDSVREDALVAIEALQSAGWRVQILSGDHPDIVQIVGKSLGLDKGDCLGGVTPEEKLDVVRRAVADRAASGNSTGPIVMVGDGVNDAAALSAADVGIAVHGGAEASLAAADIYLNKPGLRAVVELLQGSRRTMTVIHRNLAASLFYNSVAAALAITGVINPLLAAILMPVSSLTVVTLSFRSRTFSSGSNEGDS